MKIKNDESKSTRIELKKVLKGRPLYFALMAPGSKRGKFRLSKKKSDVKPADFKKNYCPYEDDKDNNLKGAACQGVVTGDKGVLTLHLDGKAPGSALRFLDHFILRELKFKQVRDIRIAETDQLPLVPEDDPLDGTSDASTVQRRLEELQQRLNQEDDGTGLPAVAQKLQEAQQLLAANKLEDADEALDTAESLFPGEEHLASYSDASPDLTEIQNQLNAAKDKAGFLPADALQNVGQLISAAQKLIDAKPSDDSQADEARDAVSELDDAIDGAFQNFFLKNLQFLVPAEDTLAEGARTELEKMKKLVRRRDWTTAMSSFEQLKKLLAAAPPATGAAVDQEIPPAPSEPPEDVYIRRRRELEDLLLRGQRLDRDNALKYGNIWNYAEEQADDDEYEKALDALTRLETMLKAAIQAAPDSDAARLGIPPGIVEQRKRILQSRWQEALRECRSKVESFKSSIATTIPEEDPADLVQAIHLSLDDFYEDMNNAITAAMGATGEAPKPLEDALAMVRKYRTLIATDDLIQHLKTTRDELGVDGNLEPVLNGALDDIESSLAGPDRP